MRTQIIKVTLYVLVIVFLTSQIAISFARFPDLNTLQTRDDLVISSTLKLNTSVKQSFISRKSNLSSIIFFFNVQENHPNEEKQHQLFFSLYDSNFSKLASASYKIPASKGDFSLEFSFKPQTDSLNKKYYVSIETDSPIGQLSIWSSLDNFYSGGDAYLNETALPYDLTFETYYKPSFSFWISDLLCNSLQRLFDLIFITVLFSLLGCSVCYLFNCFTKDAIESAIYALIVSLATPPILFYFMSATEININKVHIFYILIIISGLTGLKFLTKKSKLQLKKTNKIEAITLLVLFILATMSRVSQISQLIGPNWVGGIVHQEFISKIIERQSISLNTIYPKGFHSNVVFVYLISSRLNDVEATLIMGQWLSLLSGLSFFLLARKLLGMPYSFFAVAIYWFWSPFPSFLINWARYPFLQSLVFIPAITHIFDNNSLSRISRNILLTITIIGLGVTYYGGFLIFIGFVIIKLINVTLTKKPYIDFLKLKDLVICFLPIIIILLPRLVRIFNLSIYGQEAFAGLINDSMQAFKISTTHTGAFIWLLGIGGILLVIKFNSKRFLLLINWVLILLLLNAYQTIFNFTVSSLANTIIFLTIPLTLLFGFFIKFVWVITIKHYVSLLFLVYCISLCGMYYISSIIESSYVLLFPEDKLTMEWIVKNTSSESRFLINSFYWGEDLAPSDGGGWLTMLANRETILYDPSIVNNSLQNIDYIYLGKGRGIITEGFILSNGQFSLVYENNSVKIFKRNNK